MTRKELLKHIGSVEQIGGIKDFTFNDGRAKGVRGIEINTGKIRFIVLPDRCMDIANAYYKENAVSWVSKTGITSSYFYDRVGLEWLRGFYGGLVTTCGLRNIGGPVDEHGLHGRIANTPACNVCVSAEWVGDEYIMKVSGEMRESVVFGENLVLKRTITTKLFADEFTLEDTVINEGFKDERVTQCYHCNFGYPLVCDGAKIINVPAEVADITSPIHAKEEECINVDYTDDIVTVGIENHTMGAYLTYKRDTMPDFLIWKMLGESDYVVGLEPRTTSCGGPNIKKHDAYVLLKPLEEYKSYLKFSFKDK